MPPGDRYQPPFPRIVIPPGLPSTQPAATGDEGGLVGKGEGGWKGGWKEIRGGGWLKSEQAPPSPCPAPPRPPPQPAAGPRDAGASPVAHLPRTPRHLPRLHAPGRPMWLSGQSRRPRIPRFFPGDFQIQGTRNDPVSEHYSGTPFISFCSSRIDSCFFSLSPENIVIASLKGGFMPRAGPSHRFSIGVGRSLYPGAGIGLRREEGHRLQPPNPCEKFDNNISYIIIVIKYHYYV